MARADLPTGTVTFLFTDVEGSTRLLDEHGERYADLLAEHRRLLRAAFARHGGVEVDTQGDAFFYAFARASGALAAAEEGRRALAATPVRVRIGLHTGEPTVTEDGYVGVDVHKAARIAAAGHGGQVLVSEQTARLIQPSNSLLLVDLGLHRLKDLSAPEQIYQLGERDFPPLKTLYQTNLPVPANPLVGRKKELADVLRLVARERARVVTVTGPGGIGKTRFALAAAAEAADAFAGGIWFVDLSPLREGALVLPSIAQALGAKVDAADHIGDRELLLVLDNLEQVVDSAGELGRLVAACTHVQVLVTSREALRIGGERQYALPPLPESPAVELFRQRADAAVAGIDVDYAVAAEICDRVDRLPLAIELAAARVNVLAPEELHARLERRLPLLAGRARDVPERQRTLTATIAWSHELLSDDDQRLFRRLATFSGGATFEAAEAVASADLDALQSLVEKSLLRRRGDRFVMLETIREYAVDRLDESDEGDAVRRRHAEHYLRLAESANLTALAEGEQRHELVAREQDNVRGALAWALEGGEIELGLQLAIAAENWWVAASPNEGYWWLSAFLDRAGGALSRELLAAALRSCASTTYSVGDYERGTRYIERSLDEYRLLGDEKGTGHMRLRLAVEARRVGDTERARSLATESLESAHRAGFRRGEPLALALLARLELDAGRSERGIELLEEASATAERIGFVWWQAGVLLELAGAEWRLGRLQAAERHARESLAIAHRIGDRSHTVGALASLARVASTGGRRDRAGVLWGAVEAEEQRAPLTWAEDRRAWEAAVAGDGGGAFAHGRARGALLSLEEAVEYALGES